MGYTVKIPAFYDLWIRCTRFSWSMFTKTNIFILKIPIRLCHHLNRTKVAGLANSKPKPLLCELTNGLHNNPKTAGKEFMCVILPKENCWLIFYINAYGYGMARNPMPTAGT